MSSKLQIRIITKNQNLTQVQNNINTNITSQTTIATYTPTNISHTDIIGKKRGESMTIKQASVKTDDYDIWIAPKETTLTLMSQFIPSSKILQFKNIKTSKTKEITVPNIAGIYKLYIIDSIQNISPPSSYDILVFELLITSLTASWGNTLSGRIIQTDGWFRVNTQYISSGTFTITSNILPNSITGTIINNTGQINISKEILNKIPSGANITFAVIAKNLYGDETPIFNFDFDKMKDVYRNISTKFIGNKDCRVYKIFRNIKSLQVLNAVLPIESLIFTNNTVLNINLLSLPYIILNISGINDINIGTNNIINKCFCKLVYKDNKNINGIRRKICNFVPISNEIKYYLPRPLDNLSKMFIEFLTPQGQLISNQNDVFKPTQIKITDKDGRNSDNLFIQINFDNGEYINKNIIDITDIIIFKNITITQYNIDSDPVLESIKEQFIYYLHRESGHHIINREDTNSLGNYNKSFIIQNNLQFNKSNGTYANNNYGFTNNKLTDFFAQLSQSTTVITGYAINNSIQNSLTLNITTQEMYMDHNLNKRII